MHLLTMTHLVRLLRLGQIMTPAQEKVNEAKIVINPLLMTQLNSGYNIRVGEVGFIIRDASIFVLSSV